MQISFSITGLGLSLSKSIVERHKGEFYIDNDCPNTCFVVIIPGVTKEGIFKEAI